ncbi:MAG: thiol:disulfide interchange protein DsbA/DsbL [Pseudomonadota bacterium]
MNHTLPTRRDFNTLCLAGLTAGAGLMTLGGPALAQAAPAEGRQYKRLAQPLPVSANGKVEVVEFFWYGCPHCYALEPMVEQWAAKLPADVAFRRVPAAFTPQYEFHQKVFYALEAMGQVHAVHRKLFDAIHQQKRRMGTEDEVAAFVATLGVDATKFKDMLKSFSVIGKARQARSLADGYRIEGVPAIGVHGRYLTSPSMVGGNERTFEVVDFLVAQARQSL